MSGCILKNIQVNNESRSYIDCLYSVLTSSGKYAGPKYMLSGMAGFPFIFVVHRDLIAASTELYPLKTTAVNAMERMGFYLETYDGIKSSPTFSMYQNRAMQRVKESIDRGVAAIAWDMGITDFIVVFGYDDEDEVFFYRDRYHKDNQVLLYSNFGKSRSNYWMCQIIGEKVDKDIRDIYMESLEFAVDSFHTCYIDEIIFRGEVASGKKAYDYLIDALTGNDFYDFGAGKLLHYNIVSKNEACLYLSEVKRELPEVSPAYLKYRELNEIYKDIKKLLPDYWESVDKYHIDRIDALPGIIEKCKRAKEVEEQAVLELKNLLGERLSNRYVDVYDVKKFK